MNDRLPPELDMTPEGEFRDPPAVPLAERIFRYALVFAVLAGLVCVALLALWFAIALIPVVLGAALIAWLAFRYRLWQASGGWDRMFGRGRGGPPGQFR